MKIKSLGSGHGFDTDNHTGVKTHIAQTAGGMFWWAQVVAVTSGVAGLLLSAQEWMSTASGATMILVACVWFALSSVWARLRRPHRLS